MAARRWARVLAVGALSLAASCRFPGQASGPLPVEAASPLRTEVMGLLEDVERTRMLLGAAMWQVHDLRNFALYAGADPAPLAELDRESLRLYEAVKPIDYGAASLLAALDLGDDRTAPADLRFLQGELAALARQVLAHYRNAATQHQAARQRLLEGAAADGLAIRRIPGKPWDDPIREWQRRHGVQIGWRTNVEPPLGFRESLWNRLQKLDIRYQLAKGRMLGVTCLTFKDPVLRWDFVEPRKGRYDFRALDRMMGLAAENGMNVRLVLPTLGGRVPDWWLAERPQAIVKGLKGETEYALNAKVYAHDFMGPPHGGTGPWYRSRAVNLTDPPTRERFARCVQAIADHCRRTGHIGRIIAVSADLFHAQRSWRVPEGADRRQFVLAHYRTLGDMLRKAFAPVPIELEVTDGEAHHVDLDYTAHEWRSMGLTRVLGLPGVASETPFFEDLMRAVAADTAAERAGRPVDAGPFFYQHCEYGFGTMLSVNYFTSLLRDGLWSEGWFGPEGILRWGYFPQVFTYNDRQLQWSAITNRYLGNRQAHLLGATLANTRVAPADVALLLPSSSLDTPNSRTNRELVGWGWALTALKVQYDVLTEATLARGVPSRTRLLILPQATVLGSAHVAAIRTFVGNGGLLLASRVPGTDGTKPSPLADVLGCDVARRDGKPVEVTQTGVKGTWLQTTVARGMHSGKFNPVPRPDEGYPRPDYRDGRAKYRIPYQALAPAQGARAAAVYGTGQPAIVDHRFGKGRALTLGYPYGHELVFADWTSIAFGKIYNGWARDEQILGMVRWLRDELGRLGYARKTTVPEAWRFRLQRWEAAASSLSYPKGPDPAAGPAWAVPMSYLDPRPGHRIPQDHDAMDYAAELTWRDRSGLATRYLAVGNRESAYAGERGSVQFWLMPHTFRIRIDDPAIRRVVDVAAGVPVRLERDARGVSFATTVPPALGRVFAVSRSDAVELFQEQAFPGLSFEALEGSVARIAGRRPARPRSEVLHAADIHRWLQTHRGRKLTVACGQEAYRAAGERLARWLGRVHGIEAEATVDDGRFVVGKHGFQVVFHPTEAQVLVGNAWSSNQVASLDATWPYNTREAPATPSGRLTATYAWPGGERGIVALTREHDLRRADHTAFGVAYGDTRGFAPRGVNSASKPHLRQRLLLLASTPDGALNAVKALERTSAPRAPRLCDYAAEGQLAPLPEGTASLYRTPWRAAARTASAHAALGGIGVYYKHVPHQWGEAGHTAVMKQMAACGVRRLRLAPHHAIYITKDWTQPKPRELAALRDELRSCKAAGIRPCVVFVHIPPLGRPGTRDLQDWWRQGELLPAGDVGSPEFKAFLEKTWLALKVVLDEARAAGFTNPLCYDLEMGQNLWWGAPAVPRPLPHTTLEALRPGGRIYEFDLALIRRLRAEGYAEPTLWWGQTYHYFERCTDAEVPEECAGRALSFYSAWTGTTNATWLTRRLFEKPHGPNDVWPLRPPLRFLEGTPPTLVLAKPEGWMADRSRRDCLLELIGASAKPIVITSLGTVPGEIPRVGRSPLDGWQIKQRALTRTLAFWLNQGAPFVLLHSAYEPGSRRSGEGMHSLIPNPIDPATFRWQEAPPLVALRHFADALKGAKPVEKPRRLRFRYALSPDPVLIPPRQRASDLVAILPFQLDERRFAVAAYVVTPNIADPLRPVRMTLEIGCPISAKGVALRRPAVGMTGTALVLDRTDSTTTLSFDLHDHVTWLRFETEKP